MTIIGNHMKFNAHKSLRERVRSFYLDVLQCTTMPSPDPDLDLFLFSDSFVLGVFFCEQADVLSEENHLKAAWLEIKTKDVQEIKRRYGRIRGERGRVSRQEPLLLSGSGWAGFSSCARGRRNLIWSSRERSCQSFIPPSSDSILPAVKLGRSSSSGAA